MSTEVNCPLCGGHSHALIEEIKYDDIRYVYRKVFKIELAQETTQLLHYLLCLECDLRFFTPPVCGPPDFYEQLQKFPWYYLPDKSEYHIAKQFAVENGSVLEVGCGSGNFFDFLPKGCSYRGLEFNELAVAKARARGLSVERGSIEEFAERETQAFDLVCSFQVLEHVEFPAKFLEASARLLKPGGLLVVSVPSEDSLVADALNNVLNTPPHHITRWSDQALRNVSRILGPTLIHLEHEKLSVENFIGFSRARIFQALRRTFGFRFPLVSRLAATYPCRAAVYAVAKPIEWGYKGGRKLPIGHSIVAAYRKQ